MGFDSLPIATIVVGERRREDFGDIDGLAASIKRYGLLHPVVVDDADVLVAGERRLRACQQLGWSEIPVRRLGQLTDAEHREIELEENLRRKDLTAFERGKTLVRLVETVREVAQAVAPRESEVSVPNGNRNPQGGRPPGKTSGSLRDIAERIGEPVSTIVKAERHVETAEQFPFMQKPDWRQYHVLEARERLERIPEPERPKAAALIDQPGIPPRDANEMLGNLARMPEPERERIYKLHESPDPRDQDRAVTDAAKRPPMPDPRILMLEEALAKLRKAVQHFPNDPETPRLREVTAELRSVLETIRKGQAA